MDKIATSDIPAEEKVKIKAAIQECLAAMDRANERMESDQAEIERLKKETRAIIEKIKAA